MEIIDFETASKWHELTAEQAHTIAHLENDARKRAKVLIEDEAGFNHNPTRVVALAHTVMQNYEGAAANLFEDIVAVNELQATNTQSNTSEEFALKLLIPELSNPILQNDTWLGKHIAVLRGRGRQVTQTEIANTAGITVSHMSLLKSGRRAPSTEVAHKLVEVIADLYGFEAESREIFVQGHWDVLAGQVNAIREQELTE